MDNAPGNPPPEGQPQPDRRSQQPSPQPGEPYNGPPQPQPQPQQPQPQAQPQQPAPYGAYGARQPYGAPGSSGAYIPQSPYPPESIPAPPPQQPGTNGQQAGYSQPNGQQPYGQQPYGQQYPPYPPPAQQQYQAQPPGETAPAPVSTRRVLMYSGVALLVLVLVIGAFLVGGEPGAFMLIGAQIAPLAILAWLAYGGVKSQVSGLFAYVWLAILAMLVLLNSLVSVLIGVVKDFNGLNSSLGTPGALNATNINDMFKPGAGGTLLLALLLLFVASVLSALTLLRPVRVALAKIMPIDPDNFVHKIALCILSMIMLSSFVPLIVLGGQPPLLQAVNNGSLQSATSSGNTIGTRPVDLLYQFVWTIPAAFVCAGWPIARNWRKTLERLGMVKPTLLQVVMGLALGFGLAIVASLVIDPAINWIWTTLGLPTTDTAAFEKLMGQLITPIGAVVIGVTAGVGEEMAVRGLLQPRLGLIASNLVFTSLHAYQYGVDALLSVFIIGLILGIIRSRSNTTTSAIVHGVYDFALVMASVLSGG